MPKLPAVSRRGPPSQSSAELTAAFVDHAPGLLCVLTAEGAVHRASDALAAALGAPRAEVKGSAFIDWIHPDDRTRAAQFFRAVLDDPRVAYVEARCRPREGDDLWLRWEGRPLLEGRFVGAVATDVSRERALLGQLSAAQRREGSANLAAGVAHDFNNLLSIISVHAAFLAEEPLCAEAASDLSAVREACRSASELTRRLLTLSGERAPDPVPLQPAALLLDLSKLFRRVLGEDVRLSLELESDDWVVIDPCQLEQVIMNLVVNARDAMPRGGELAFRVRTEAPAPNNDCLGCGAGPHVELVVRDTGPGIAPELQERIFEPFFTTKAERGNGLGLSTSRAVVERAGGKLSVASAPGQGTRFCLCLPVAAAPAGTPRPAPPTPRPPRPPLGSVLLVEDDPQVLAVLERIFRPTARSVTSARSLEEARLAYATDAACDLLVSDLRLPDGRGDQLLDELRERWPALRAIFVSGYGVHAEHALPDDVVLLRKPIDRSALLSAAGAPREPRDASLNG